MEWYSVNAEKFNSIIKLNSAINNYMLCLSPNTKHIKQNEINNFDICYTIKYVKDEPTIYDIKKCLIDLQKEYDTSEYVNILYINNNRVWFDKNTRASIVNAIRLNQNSTYNLWLNSNNIEIENSKAIEMFTKIEEYACKCFVNTKNNIAEIMKLSTIEECLNYDVTKGYPNILKIQID